jgi:hypothetical protein
MGFGEEIDDQIKTGFHVTDIPRGIMREFKALCRENYGDIYWVGISELIKTKKKYDEMLTIFSSMQKQINDLNSIIKLQEEKNHVRVIKTFGQAEGIPVGGP